MKPTAPILVPGGHLSGDLAGTWAAAALAEITHGPTGYADLDMTRVRLAPGGTATPVAALRGPGPLLLAVLQGRIRVTASATGDDVLVATAGDAVAIPPNLPHHVAVEADGDEAAEYLVYVLPVPAPRDGPPP